MHQKHKNTVTQNKLKQLKCRGLVASYDLRSGNWAGLFSRKRQARNKDKWEAHDVYKQTMYTAPKSTNASRAQYYPEPAGGTLFWGSRTHCNIMYLVPAQQNPIPKTSSVLSSILVQCTKNTTTFGIFRLPWTTRLFEGYCCNLHTSNSLLSHTKKTVDLQKFVSAWASKNQKRCAESSIFRTTPKIYLASDCQLLHQISRESIASFLRKPIDRHT